VLVDPPVIAQADTEVGEHQPERVVAPAYAADLLMSRVMAEERQLRQNHPGVRRDSELPRGVAEPQQPSDTDRREPGEDKDSGQVPNGRAVEKSSRSHLG
jgi:hypothetical protein